MQPMEHIRSAMRQLPQKKPYVEFVSAILTIPVLATVIITNVNNIAAKSAPTPTPTPAVVSRDIASASGKNVTPDVPRATSTPVPQPTQPANITVTPGSTPVQEACRKEIGPIDIISPRENEQVGKNPVCIEISRQAAGYCGVSWSYRIHPEDWSPYTDKEICLYGLSGGPKTLELKVRSIVSEDQKVLLRNFSVSGPAASPTPQSTASASPAN